MFLFKNVQSKNFDSNKKGHFQIFISSTRGGVETLQNGRDPPVAQRYRSKLEGGKCQVQTPVALVDLAVPSFPWFSPKLA